MLAASEPLLFQLVICVVFGGICAAIASGRGRSPLGWFFVGAFLNCIGIIVILVLPDLKVEEERRRRHALETRRLREQLAKERQVADERHHHVERRLGVHDQALGVDTARPPELANTAAPPALPNAGVWFYARGQERLGPVAAETIRHLLQAQVLSPRSLVWREGMADWQPLDSVDDFAGEVS
jgi:GYF domain 2